MTPKIAGERSAGGDRCQFTVDRPLLPGASAFFGGPAEAIHSSRLRVLLEVPSAETVMVADNVVTLSATDVD